MQEISSIAPDPTPAAVGTTRVVHVADVVPGAIYIGRAVVHQRIRASKWGNPYRVETFGRAGAIRLYREFLTGDSNGRKLLAELPKLRGHALVCWCRHDGEARTDENACHGDVLVELLEQYTDEQLREMAA